MVRAVPYLTTAPETSTPPTPPCGTLAGVYLLRRPAGGSCSMHTRAGECLAVVPLARAQHWGSSYHRNGRKTGSCPPHPISKVHDLTPPPDRPFLACRAGVPLDENRLRGRSFFTDPSKGLTKAMAASTRAAGAPPFLVRTPHLVLPPPPGHTHGPQRTHRTGLKPCPLCIPSLGSRPRSCCEGCAHHLPQGGQQGAAGERPAPAP